MTGKLKDGLYKRGNSWYIQIKVRGKRYRKSFGPSRRDAELALADIRRERALARVKKDWSGLAKLFEPQCKLTFKDAAEKYLSERAHIKASSKYTYREHLDNHILPVFGDVRLTDITEEQIAKFKSSLAAKLSPRRANGSLRLLSSILKTNERRGLIEVNPSKGVDALTEPPTDINPLSRDELDKVLSCISPTYSDIFVCLAWTGARPGELKALRWKDIDLTRGEIRIRKARYRGTEEALPKTRSSVRTLTMLPPVRQVLTAKRAALKVLQLDGHVFLNKSGKPINRDLSTVWAEALRKAKLAHRPSYQLRHTFASLCLANGAAPGWVSKELGHDSLQTTFRYYARYIPDSGQQVQRLSETLFDHEGMGPQSGPQAPAQTATHAT